MRYVELNSGLSAIILIVKSTRETPPRYKLQHEHPIHLYPIKITHRDVTTYLAQRSRLSSYLSPYCYSAIQSGERKDTVILHKILHFVQKKKKRKEKPRLG